MLQTGCTYSYTGLHNESWPGGGVVLQPGCACMTVRIWYVIYSKARKFLFHFEASTVVFLAPAIENYISESLSVIRQTSCKIRHLNDKTAKTWIILQIP